MIYSRPVLHYNGHHENPNRLSHFSIFRLPAFGMSVCYCNGAQPNVKYALLPRKYTYAVKNKSPKFSKFEGNTTSYWQNHQII